MREGEQAELLLGFLGQQRLSMRRVSDCVKVLSLELRARLSDPSHMSACHLHPPSTAHGCLVMP
jgi:hypothetical protein